MTEEMLPSHSLGQRALVRISSAAVVGLAAASLQCQPCPCHAGEGMPSTAAEGQGAAASKGTWGGSVVPYTWKNVVILGGGFVSGIVFSPTEKGLAYARTDVGGAYRWNPASKTWIPLSDEFGRADQNAMGVESIATDPVDPNKVYAAIGTYVKPWAGNGAMLRSKDRGATWTRTEMPFQMGGNEYGRSNGERLAVDPNDPRILYFGSRPAGLWKSTDSGASWSKVASFPISQDPKGYGVDFVVFDKASGAPGKPTPSIYAGVAKTDGTLYASTDAGAAWTLVPKQPTGLMASHAEFDSKGILYLSYGSDVGPNDVVDGAVWKYDPKQSDFTNITPAVPQKAGDRFGYGGLSVDAAHPGTLMVTTIDRWTKGDEIYRTADSGKTWKAIAPKAVRDDAGARYLYWDRDKPSATGWMGDIAIDPFDTGHVMYVTGQGVWSSEDADAADSDKPTHWIFSDRGLEETVVAGLVSPPAGPPLLSVVGDLGGFRHDDVDAPSAGGMFHNPIFGSGTGLDVAWLKPEVVARVGYSDSKKNGAYSLDGGATWTPFPTNPPGKGAGAIAVSADGATFLWAEKEGPPAYSHDRGATWTRAEGLPAPGKIPDWAPVNIRPAADRVNPKKFYVFDVLQGRAYRSVDGGEHFVESATGLPSLPDYNLGSGSAQAVPGVEGDVWLTTGKGVYRSKDSGHIYESVGSVTDANALGFGKAAPGAKYPAVFLIGKVGDLAGFFRSDDAGSTWARINDDHHNFGFAGVITGDPRVYGRVYIGTGGRGIVYGQPK